MNFGFSWVVCLVLQLSGRLFVLLCVLLMVLFAVLFDFIYVVWGRFVLLCACLVRNCWFA